AVALLCPLFVGHPRKRTLLPYAAVTPSLATCVIPESNLAPSPPTSARCHPPDRRSDHRIRPDSEPSNPHSGLASPNRSGACRGFLPRGLYDACPRAVVTSSHFCA